MKLTNENILIGKTWRVFAFYGRDVCNMKVEQRWLLLHDSNKMI